MVGAIMDNNNDYDYIRDFFKDDHVTLERFMRSFDGIRIRIKLDSHKRFESQVRLLRGLHPNVIAEELEMKVGTVWKIKQRLHEKLMYAVEDEI